MADPARKGNNSSDSSRPSYPPGRIKIVEALKILLAEKEFNAMVFRRDGVLFSDLHDLDLVQPDLESAGHAGRASISADGAGDNQG